MNWVVIRQLFSANELGGKSTIIFCPFVIVVCPEIGTSFNVCLLIPLIDFTQYDIPVGIDGGIFTTPPDGISL
jgi:hypothetical protein